MKNIFKLGDQKTFTKKVESEDAVVFQASDGPLHNVYSSFALARDAEWTSRLFVLDMKEGDEEGIGTMVKVHHHSPAAVGSTVVFTAKIRAIDKNEIICSYQVMIGNRLVATGETGQKILTKEKMKQKFYQLN